jgi:RNA polymerase sigma-54 factor
MKQSLQLKISQQLAMTPQLQQAIRLLQLSALELEQEIKEILEANPLLEMEEPSDEESNGTGEDQPLSALAEDVQPAEVASDEDGLMDSAPDRWEADLSSAPPPSRDADSEAEYFGSAEETLQDYLLWQANLTPFSERDAAIAEAIIDGIDDDGYLTVSLVDIAESTNAGDDPVEEDEVEAVLHRIQRFDPVGVGARDLRECLLVQLEQFDAEDPVVVRARLLIERYLPLLGQKNYRQLRKDSGLEDEQIKEALSFIQALNPRPGNRVSSESQPYVVPDVYVRKIGERWVAQLNPEALPRVRLNESYAQLARQCQSPADNQFIRDHLQEARWLLKSLESRHDTLLKVSQQIVEHQQGFFEYGEEAMRPLILSDIAVAVDMHESTISRVTTQKYLACPRGIFELKYFFSSHVGTTSGGECSSTAIKAVIRKLIEAEDRKKPLSDSKLAQLLKEQGIMVARRTVAKYREAMNIPASSERKELI